MPVLRVSFGLAALGAALVILGTPWLAFVGAAVWGVGAALGFPVGMSASADEPHRAAARMSVVATIGYVAFIAGPPVLGFLGDEVGVLRSLSVVGALALLALAVVPSVREPGPASRARCPCTRPGDAGHRGRRRAGRPDPSGPLAHPGRVMRRLSGCPTMAVRACAARVMTHGGEGRCWDVPGAMSVGTRAGHSVLGSGSGTATAWTWLQAGATPSPSPGASTR